MAQRRTDSARLKKANGNRVFKLIYKDGPISKPEIAYRLGISLPTVIQNVKSLQDAGLIEECGTLDSTGGRKAVALACVKNARLALGVDITLNHVSVVLVNMDGSVMESIREKIPYRKSMEYAETLGATVNRFVERSQVDPESILGMGVSVPGILSTDGRTLIDSHVLQIQNVPCAKFVEFCHYPCIFCNDANAAGTAEIWNRKSIENGVYLSLSNSVGGAILLNDRIFQGDNQRGGEFGHITIVRGGRKCYCGKNGCLDAYCNASVLSNLTDGDLAAFFRLLRGGNAKIVAAWDDYLGYLATAVNNLRMSFDCSVILGGYIGAYMEDYVSELQKRAAELNTFEEDGSYIKVCSYRTEAAAVGAALMHIAAFIDQVC